MSPFEEIKMIKNKKKYGTVSEMFETGHRKLLSTAQEQPLNTKSVGKIYHKDVSNKCRLLERHVENVLHVISGCSMLPQRDYKRRHNKVCLNTNWALCKSME